MKRLIYPVAMGAMVFMALSTGASSAVQMCGMRPCANQPPPPAPAGSCQPSSSLTVLVQSPNVIAYVPKGSWSSGTTGVAVVNVEGASITNTLVPTSNIVNSCASNPLTGKTVCTANNNAVYVLAGTTIASTLASGGTGTIGFSGRFVHQLRRRDGRGA